LFTRFEATANVPQLTVMSELNDNPVLSVLMAVYNERDTVAEILRRVSAVPIAMEIIIVDDGSTDGTREVLTALAEDNPKIRLILAESNAGKGAALRRAIPLARGRISIIQDADLEYNPNDYPALIEPILSGETRVVYGSRVLHPERNYPLDRFRIGSFALTMTANVLYFARLTDEPTCYKVFETDLLQSIPLTCMGFEFCPEVTAKVLRRGERIVEVPIRYDKRSVEAGKKVNWKDGVIGLWTLLKYRFSR
jgi:glycosyltransferase involved in cell wall biosynthesis